MSKQQQIIEHIVLFKVKPDADPTKVAAMIDGLNNLISLNLAIRVSAGELLRSRSSSLTFTHILHCRFKSDEDLQIYNTHTEHLRVITELIQPVLEDIMVVDWKSDFTSHSPSGSAIRVSMLKLKEDLGENEKSKFAEVIGGIKEQIKAIEVSFGENFSDAMAKGYTMCSIAVFSGGAEMEAFDSDAKLVNSIKEKLKDLVESELVVDYVIPVQKVADE